MTVRYPDTTGAPCTQQPADLWYPPTGNANTAQQRARALCRGCPVIEQCLTYALETNQEWGVWGGISAQDRSEMRKRRAS